MNRWLEDYVAPVSLTVVYTLFVGISPDGEGLLVCLIVTRIRCHVGREALINIMSQGRYIRDSAMVEVRHISTVNLTSKEASSRN